MPNTTEPHKRKLRRRITTPARAEQEEGPHDR